MSRATVRQAIVNYLAPGTVDLLATTLAHPPKVTPAGDFVLPNTEGSTTGVVLAVMLTVSHERRIALGGEHSGRKWRVYETNLICILRSTERDGEVVGQRNDDFIDSLTARIQADRTFDSGGVIFQAGEGDLVGGEDIVVEQSMPRTLNGNVSQVFNKVGLTVIEVLDT